MSCRILIVPDKFKGSLTARQAADAIARGWRNARPKDVLDLLPMSDGGDGFGEVLSGLLAASRRSVTTLDAAHRLLRCVWWWAKTKTAIIESAKINGLAMLAGKGFHPFQLDTFGLGKVLRAAEEAGAKECVVGVGGSATNDGGFGLARALGWRFFGHAGKELDEWWQLSALKSIRAPAAPLRLRLVVAVDVRNPLLGPNGCSRVYGPQKGLRPEDLDLTENCLTRLAAVLQEQHHLGEANAPGAGAAGGLGFGLSAFAGARIESGFDLFARYARLEKRIRAADLVITGEGAMDEQTRMGKGVGQIARRCARCEVPCVGLAGVVEKSVRDSNLFTHTRALTEIADLPNAHSQAARFLERLSEEMARAWRAD
ncbi:MAG TPA: glycerate kinase [Verrucomicrobiae bacterium]|jgi:glycerate kinase|nr:glycerate kinase [Verrucomicrobiae bacterium]